MVTGECTYHLALFDPSSSDAEDLIRELLQKDPAKRLGVHRNIRAHPFFQDIDWVSVEALQMPPPHIPGMLLVSKVPQVTEIPHVHDSNDMGYEEEDASGYLPRLILYDFQIQKRQLYLTDLRCKFQTHLIDVQASHKHCELLPCASPYHKNIVDVSIPDGNKFMPPPFFITKDDGLLPPSQEH
ncbi:unnamed protein product [Ranitomeya imitator]|uniref:Uncharacterized protein n=1 Tax=Ranitomeya imitator TaxID=111125 RepID=A0ABN9MKQ1_9NEOB|nr:unnamed protein product [Ranitomeya imitator]